MKKVLSTILITLLLSVSLSTNVLAVKQLQKGKITKVFYDQQFKSYSIQITFNNDETYIWDLSKGKYNKSKLTKYIKQYNNKKVLALTDDKDTEDIYDDEIISFKTTK